MSLQPITALHLTTPTIGPLMLVNSPKGKAYPRMGTNSIISSIQENHHRGIGG